MKKMTTFNGYVSISNLPPHYGMIVSLAFFEVEEMGSEPPYDGDPPGEAATDIHEIHNVVDLEIETFESMRNFPFEIEHSAGFFYLQLRAVLFRKKDEKLFAQSEQFFFGRRPLPLFDDLPSIELPIEWPSIPLEDLEYFGTIEPEDR